MESVFFEDVEFRYIQDIPNDLQLRSFKIIRNHVA